MKDYICDYIMKLWKKEQGSDYEKAKSIYDYICSKTPEELVEEVGYDFNPQYLTKEVRYKAYCLLYNCSVKRFI